MADVTSADDAQADVNPQQWLDYAKSLTASIQATGKYTGPQIQLNLRPMFDLDEVRILRAPYRLFEFGGIGDGTVPGAMIGAAGAVASGNLAVMAGSIAGNMIAGSRAKKAAIPQWHETGGGELVLTDYGLYFAEHGQAPGHVSWGLFAGATLTAWDTIELDMEGEGKTALVTPAAAAIFGLWCLAVYPQHPQLQTLLHS